MDRKPNKLNPRRQHLRCATEGAVKMLMCLICGGCFVLLLPHHSVCRGALCLRQTVGIAQCNCVYRALIADVWVFWGYGDETEQKTAHSHRLAYLLKPKPGSEMEEKVKNPLIKSVHMWPVQMQQSPDVNSLQTLLDRLEQVRPPMVWFAEWRMKNTDTGPSWSLFYILACAAFRAQKQLFTSRYLVSRSSALISGLFLITEIHNRFNCFYWCTISITMSSLLCNQFESTTRGFWKVWQQTITSAAERYELNIWIDFHQQKHEGDKWNC